MSFDPKAYLAQNQPTQKAPAERESSRTSGGFDPKAYLASTSSEVKQRAPEQSLGEKAAIAAESIGRGVPVVGSWTKELNAAIAGMAPLNPNMKLDHELRKRGFKIEQDTSYDARLKSEQRRVEDQEKENPYLTTGFKGLGALAGYGALTKVIAPAASGVERMMQAGIINTAEKAISNDEGEEQPRDATEVAIKTVKDFGTGFAFGAAGEAVAKGAGLALQGGKAAKRFLSDSARKYAQFSTSEAEQYLTNPGAVDDAVKMFQNGDLDKAQERAYAALSKMRQALSSDVRNLSKQLDDHWDPKTAQANINKIEQMIGDEPEAAVIISQVRKDLAARAPMKPEFNTTGAEQTTINGLSTPAKMAHEAPQVRSPNQGELLVPENAPKPKYKDLTHDGRPSSTQRTQPQQAEMFNPADDTAQANLFLDDATVTRTPGVAPARAASKPLTKEEQLRLHLEQEAAKVTAGESKVIPGRKEVFAAEQAPITESVQDVLPIPMGSNNPEAATISKRLLRRLRQLTGERAQFHKRRSVEESSVAKSKEYGKLYDEINDSLHGGDELAAGLDQEMTKGISMIDEIEGGMDRPLATLKSQSEDRLASLIRAAKRTGDKEAMALGEQLAAARKIIGKGDNDDWVTRQATRAAGRAGLRATESIAKLAKKFEVPISVLEQNPRLVPILAATNRASGEIKSDSDQDRLRLTGADKASRGPSAKAKRGEDKWAMRGATRLGISEDRIDSALSDKKTRYLLIEASDLPEGSKRFKEIQQQLNGRGN